jgi:hypothetical protein
VVDPGALLRWASFLAEPEPRALSPSERAEAEEALAVLANAGIVDWLDLSEAKWALHMMVKGRAAEGAELLRRLLGGRFRVVGRCVLGAGEGGEALAACSSLPEGAAMVAARGTLFIVLGDYGVVRRGGSCAAVVGENPVDAVAGALDSLLFRGRRGVHYLVGGPLYIAMGECTVGDAVRAAERLARAESRLRGCVSRGAAAVAEAKRRAAERDFEACLSLLSELQG